MGLGSGPDAGTPGPWNLRTLSIALPLPAIRRSAPELLNSRFCILDSGFVRPW